VEKTSPRCPLPHEHCTHTRTHPSLGPAAGASPRACSRSTRARAARWARRRSRTRGCWTRKGERAGHHDGRGHEPLRDGEGGARQPAGGAPTPQPLRTPPHTHARTVYTLLDAPGHRDFVQSTVSGIAQVRARSIPPALPPSQGCAPVSCVRHRAPPPRCRCLNRRTRQCCVVDAGPGEAEMGLSGRPDRQSAPCSCGPLASRS